MIDHPASVREHLRAHSPDLRAERIQPVGTGWDSHAYLVDDEWIVRYPRRPEVGKNLRTETTLLRWLQQRLPAAVPVPELVTAEPLCVRHRIVRGEPVARGQLGAAAGLGRFLAALHAVPVAEAVARGVPDQQRSREESRAHLADMHRRVLPLLNRAERRGGLAVLAAASACDGHQLVHGDLGPDHVLTAGDRLAGVIDWSDARVADPARDLAWPLHGADATFGAVVAAAYGGVPDALCDRALGWHRLGPWYEVLHGLDGGGDAFVASGLAGVRARLPAARGGGEANG